MEYVVYYTVYGQARGMAHGAGAVAVDGGGDAPAPPAQLWDVGCGMVRLLALALVGRLLVLIASCQQQPAGMAGVPAENPDAWGRIGLASGWHGGVMGLAWGWHGVGMGPRGVGTGTGLAWGWHGVGMGSTNWLLIAID
jgi:hypothetical protein